METQPSTETSVVAEKPTNKIPWTLIVILVFIAVIYALSLSFWTGKNQGDESKWAMQEDAKTVEKNSQNDSSQAQSWPNLENNTAQDEGTMGKSNLKDEITWKYKKFASFLLDASWQKNMKNSAFTNIWGDENITPLSETRVEVTYPKGSYKPSASPRWGAGFIYNLWESYDEISMSYDIEFAKNFDFVKWGKLPWLCGGTCPRGTEKGEGISVNLWWDKEQKLWISVLWSGGKSLLDEALNTVDAGGKYTINLSIKMNTPWQNDGSIIVTVNGQKVLSQENILLRDIKDVSVDSLFFSTFFGGSDESWATPVDTSIIFSNFKIYGTRKQ